MDDYTCPKCGKRTVSVAGNAFIEEGEYNGSSYEIEGNATKHACEGCGFEFYTRD